MMLVVEQDFEYCIDSTEQFMEGGNWSWKYEKNPLISNQATLSLRHITEILPRPQEVAGNVPTP